MGRAAFSLDTGSEELLASGPAWTLTRHLVLGDSESDFCPVPGHPSRVPSEVAFPGEKAPWWVWDPSSCVSPGLTKSKGTRGELLAVPSSGPSSLLLLPGWELPPSSGCGHLWVLLVPPSGGWLAGFGCAGRELGVNDLLPIRASAARAVPGHEPAPVGQQQQNISPSSSLFF